MTYYKLLVFALVWSVGTPSVKASNFQNIAFEEVPFLGGRVQLEVPAGTSVHTPEGASWRELQVGQAQVNGTQFRVYVQDLVAIAPDRKDSSVKSAASFEGLNPKKIRWSTVTESGWKLYAFNAENSIVVYSVSPTLRVYRVALEVRVGNKSTSFRERLIRRIAESISEGSNTSATTLPAQVVSIQTDIVAGADGVSLDISLPENWQSFPIRGKQLGHRLRKIRDLGATPCECHMSFPDDETGQDVQGSQIESQFLGRTIVWNVVASKKEVHLAARAMIYNRSVQINCSIPPNLQSETVAMFGSIAYTRR